MVRKDVFFVLLVLFVLLGCTEELDKELEVEDIVTGESQTAARERAPAQLDETPEGAVTVSEVVTPCTAGWKCMSSRKKIYQLANCSFGERIDCPLGCENDACVVRTETCDSGFMCKDDFTIAFQTESCSWIRETECEWGCEDGECRLEAESVAEQVDEPSSAVDEEEQEERIQLSTLRMGESTTVEVDGVEHSISLYLIQAGEVKMKIDDERSEWMNEGDSFSYDGVTIVVEEILFQSFDGGIRQVGYRVG